MGLYWNTYLCSGKFIDINNASIYIMIKLATVDQIIEKKEWDNGLVDKNELMKYLATKDNLKNIRLIKPNIEEIDLFLAEVCATTLDTRTNDYKYILVERNCDYEYEV